MENTYIDSYVDLIGEDIGEVTFIDDEKHFFSKLDREWVKVAGQNRIDYHHLPTGMTYKKDVAIELNQEYQNKAGDLLFQQWAENKKVVHQIKTSSEKQGYREEGRKKIYFQYDDRYIDNVVANVGFDEIDQIFRDLHNNVTAPGCPSSFRNMREEILEDGVYQEGCLYFWNGGSGDSKTWMLSNEAIGIACGKSFRRVESTEEDKKLKFEEELESQKRVGFIQAELTKKICFNRLLQIRYDKRNIIEAEGQYIADRNRGIHPFGKMTFIHTGFYPTTDTIAEKLRDCVPREEGLTDEEFKKKIEEYYDILIVDYINIMEPSRHTDDQFDRLKLVAEDLVNLGKLFKCPVLSATQANNTTSNLKGDRKRDAGYTSIAGSNRVAHPSTGVFHISKDSIQPQMRRVTVAKNRLANPNYKGEGHDLYYRIKPSGKFVEAEGLTPEEEKEAVEILVQIESVTETSQNSKKKREMTL